MADDVNKPRGIPPSVNGLLEEAKREAERVATQRTQVARGGVAAAVHKRKQLVEMEQRTQATLDVGLRALKGVNGGITFGPDGGSIHSYNPKAFPQDVNGNPVVMVPTGDGQSVAVPANKLVETVRAAPGRIASINSQIDTTSRAIEAARASQDAIYSGAMQQALTSKLGSQDQSDRRINSAIRANRVYNQASRLSQTKSYSEVTNENEQLEEAVARQRQAITKTIASNPDAVNTEKFQRRVQVLEETEKRFAASKQAIAIMNSQGRDPRSIMERADTALERAASQGPMIRPNSISSDLASDINNKNLDKLVSARNSVEAGRNANLPADKLDKLIEALGKAEESFKDSSKELKDALTREAVQREASASKAGAAATLAAAGANMTRSLFVGGKISQVESQASLLGWENRKMNDLIGATYNMDAGALRRMTSGSYDRAEDFGDGVRIGETVASGLDFAADGFGAASSLIAKNILNKASGTKLLKGMNSTVSQGIGKGIAKVGGKGLAKKYGAKFLAKKIPVVGAAAGLAFGAQRAVKGDYGGAAMEVASGLASTVPGYGTAASVGIDGALIAKDLGAFKGAASTGGGLSGIETAGAVATGASRLVNSGQNLVRDTSANNAKAAARSSYMGREDAGNGNIDALRNIQRDFVLNARQATLGFGSRRSAMMDSATDASRLRAYAQQENGALNYSDVLSGFATGSAYLGSEFNERMIGQAGRAQLAGTGSVSDYLRRTAELANVGGSDANLEKLLTTAVAKGMGESRDVEMMNQALQQISRATASRGSSSVEGSNILLNAAMERGSGAFGIQTATTSLQEIGRNFSSRGVDYLTVAGNARLANAGFDAQDIENIRRPGNENKVAQILARYRKGDVEGARIEAAEAGLGNFFTQGKDGNYKLDNSKVNAFKDVYSYATQSSGSIFRMRDEEVNTVRKVESLFDENVDGKSFKTKDEFRQLVEKRYGKEALSSFYRYYNGETGFNKNMARVGLEGSLPEGGIEAPGAGSVAGKGDELVSAQAKQMVKFVEDFKPTMEYFISEMKKLTDPTKLIEGSEKLSGDFGVATSSLKSSSDSLQAAATKLETAAARFMGDSRSSQSPEQQEKRGAAVNQ